MVSENWSIRDWKRIVYAIGVCRRLSIIVGTVKASRGEYLIGLGIPQVIIYYDITVRFTTYCCIFLSNSSSFSPSSAFIAGVRTFPCGIESEQVFNCIDYSKSFIRVRFFRTIVSLRFLLFFKYIFFWSLLFKNVVPHNTSINQLSQTASLLDVGLPQVAPKHPVLCLPHLF